MSISEQIENLRRIAKEWNPDTPINPVSVTLNQAADTIESLSAKLQAENMEKSAEDFGGWIPCSERLPEENKDVLAKRKDGEVELLFRIGKDYYSTSTGDYVCADVYEWIPIP